MPLYAMLLILSLGSSIEAFKILVLYPTPSFSHQRPIMALTESLVQKGHEVFVVSPNSVPGLASTNYTHVDVSFSYKFFSDEKKDDVVYLQHQISKWDIPLLMRPMTSIPKYQFISEPFLQFQRRVKAASLKFDVAIVETFFVPHACAMTRFLTGDTPIISMSSMSYEPHEDYFGSFQHWSYIPSVSNPFTDRMSLWQKIQNWFFVLYLRFQTQPMMVDSAKSLFKETYGPGMETLVDGCSTNLSLSLVASNFMYYYPRLVGPNVVEVGPLHLKTPERLPKNLQDWLDGAEEGVIYFSLGSNMQSKSLPKDVRSNFLKFFRELPQGYRVLWKWEQDGRIPEQTDNILTQKWLPQESVLAHPKVRVFITQGGLQSFQEAVHHGVPTVGIPWFADQEGNVAKMVDAGIGARLLPQELHSYQKIKKALDAVLYDDKYLKNMKRHSVISHDFTSQAREKAVFWVEHVARHGGASHLRPSTADTTYFQFFCLDIISLILVLSCIILYTLSLVIRFLKPILLYLVSFKVKKS